MWFLVVMLNALVAVQMSPVVSAAGLTMATAATAAVMHKHPTLLVEAEQVVAVAAAVSLVQ